MGGAWSSLAWLLLAPLFGQAFENTALKNVDRRIEKQPAYNSKRPLYGLLVFGPAADKPVWMVLDRSKPEAEHYDLLYVDLNANGDLSESAERFVGEMQGNDVRFHLPDVNDPVTKAIHTHFTVRVSQSSEPLTLGIMLFIPFRWRRRSQP